MNINSSVVPVLSGHVTVKTVSGDVPYDQIMAAPKTVLFSKKNLIVAGAQQVIINLLRGNALTSSPAFISLGTGGDYNGQTLTDTGARVGPLFTDTSLRILGARLPIIYSKDGSTSNSWTYVVVARPHEAILDEFDELGVETEEGTLISHYITDAAIGGRATKYSKTSLEYLIIEWEFSLLLATPTSYITATENVTQGLLRSSSGGSNPINTTVPAFIQPGVVTTLAVVSTSASEQLGDMALNEGSVISAQLNDGSPAIIILEQI